MKINRRLLAIGLGSLAVLVGVLFLIVSISRTTLEIRELVVTGESDARAVADVRRAVQAELTGGFFSQDLDVIKQAVERLTWVKSATVARVWPDSISVTVTRLDPVARWEDGRLVSREGIVFMPLVEEAGKTAMLPLILADTVEYAPEAIRFLKRFEDIAAKARARVQSVAVSYRGSWTVTLVMPRGTALRIELGRAVSSDTVFERLQLVLDYYKQVCETLRGCPSFIDARYEHAFAARWPNSQFESNENSLGGR